MTLSKVATSTVQTLLRGLLITVPFAISAIAQTCNVTFIPQNIVIPTSAGNGSFEANVSGQGTCPFTAIGSPSPWLAATTGNGASTSSGALFFGFSFGAGAAAPRTGAITVLRGSSSPGSSMHFLSHV